MIPETEDRPQPVRTGIKVESEPHAGECGPCAPQCRWHMTREAWAVPMPVKMQLLDSSDVLASGEDTYNCIFIGIGTATLHGSCAIYIGGDRATRDGCV